jgi:diguanylate cyclase (GGDEF)-like protein
MQLVFIPLISDVFWPRVTDRRSLRRYVVSTTALALIVALAIESLDLSIFFTSWTACLRELSVTVATVVVLAVPIAASIGRAHLSLHNAKREAEQLSRTDPLTGIANRRAFYEAAAGFVGGAVALAIVDIDRFKRINDRNGHAAGDLVLKAVATMMRVELGDLGVVARIGGEEFALISTHASAAVMRDRLQAFRRCVAETPTTAAAGSVEVTVSIGFACRRLANLDALYSSADAALYAAKSAGRNCVVDYDEIGDLASRASAGPMAQAS